MTTMTPANDIGGQMYQHKKPAKRESSSEEMEESDEDLSLGRAASGGASAPQPPRARGVGPEFYSRGAFKLSTEAPKRRTSISFHEAPEAVMITKLQKLSIHRNPRPQAHCCCLLLSLLSLLSDRRLQAVHPHHFR
mmetsp:Transcript_2675/g.4300  ORF Transcript_2675/g.4300 Transcript_2675/m.4300 type:complete len:136 (+) Transcript_2675:589-996(+)